MIKKYNKCNKECEGIIKELKQKGINFPTKIIVNYKVNDKTYTIEENLVMKKEKTLLLGFIPIGYTTKSLISLKTGIPSIVGNSVKVKYEEENPGNAYLIDNVSKSTWY